MFDAISNVAYTTANLLKSAYIICLWVGWAITTAIAESVKWIFFVANNLLLAVSILCEDFLCFLEDLGDVTEKLVLGIVDTLWSTVDSFVAFSSLITCSITSIPNLVYQIVMSIKIGNYVINFLVLVKDAVFLLGLCIWEAFTLLFVLLSYINDAPFIALMLMARAADYMIYEFLATVQTHWFRSICGLCIGYATYQTAKNTGVLPEGTFKELSTQFLKQTWCFLLALSRESFSFLRSAVRWAFDFCKSKSQTLKTCCISVIREIVSRTNTSAGLEIRLEKEQASSRCIVCMDKRRDVIILNCRHMSMCRQCAVTVAVGTGECPVCRSPIENMLSVFT